MFERLGIRTGAEKIKKEQQMYIRSNMERKISNLDNFYFKILLDVSRNLPVKSPNFGSVVDKYCHENNVSNDSHSSNNGEKEALHKKLKNRNGFLKIFLNLFYSAVCQVELVHQVRQIHRCGNF